MPRGAAQKTLSTQKAIIHRQLQLQGLTREDLPSVVTVRARDEAQRQQEELSLLSCAFASLSAPAQKAVVTASSGAVRRLLLRSKVTAKRVRQGAGAILRRLRESAGWNAWDRVPFGRYSGSGALQLWRSGGALDLVATWAAKAVGTDAVRARWDRVLERASQEAGARGWRAADLQRALALEQKRSSSISSSSAPAHSPRLPTPVSPASHSSPSAASPPPVDRAVPLAAKTRAQTAAAEAMLSLGQAVGVGDEQGKRKRKGQGKEKGKQREISPPPSPPLSPPQKPAPKKQTSQSKQKKSPPQEAGSTRAPSSDFDYDGSDGAASSTEEREDEELVKVRRWDESAPVEPTPLPSLSSLAASTDTLLSHLHLLHRGSTARATLLELFSRVAFSWLSQPDPATGDLSCPLTLASHLTSLVATRAPPSLATALTLPPSSTHLTVDHQDDPPLALRALELVFDLLLSIRNPTPSSSSHITASDRRRWADGIETWARELGQPPAGTVFDRRRAHLFCAHPPTTSSMSASAWTATLQHQREWASLNQLSTSSPFFHTPLPPS
ncbi:hypothetical protein JCM10213_000649 [Rhodosporidiobolus nylandii]